MAPLQVDPHAYLKPHHSVGRCPWGCQVAMLAASWNLSSVPYAGLCARVRR